MLLPTTKNWLYLNNSLQISCNSTSWIRLLVKILVFISCHRKSERILENIFCPRSILSSPNTLFPQNIPFSNKLQGSTILYLIIPQYCPLFFNILQKANSALSCISCLIVRNIQILDNTHGIVQYYLKYPQFCPILPNIGQYC